MCDYFTQKRKDENLIIKEYKEMLLYSTAVNRIACSELYTMLLSTASRGSLRVLCKSNQNGNGKKFHGGSGKGANNNFDNRTIFQVYPPMCHVTFDDIQEVLEASSYLSMQDQKDYMFSLGIDFDRVVQYGAIVLKIENNYRTLNCDDHPTTILQRPKQKKLLAPPPPKPPTIVNNNKIIFEKPKKPSQNGKQKKNQSNNNKKQE